MSDQVQNTTLLFSADSIVISSTECSLILAHPLVRIKITIHYCKHWARCKQKALSCYGNGPQVRNLPLNEQLYGSTLLP